MYILYKFTSHCKLMRKEKNCTPHEHTHAHALELRFHFLLQSTEYLLSMLLNVKTTGKSQTDRSRHSMDATVGLHDEDLGTLMNN